MGDERYGDGTRYMGDRRDPADVVDEGSRSALRQSEEGFRLLVEGVRDYAIFMLDPTGHVASWNVGAERIKGYAAEEIIGQHFSRFYPEDAIRRGWPQHELSVARREGRFEDEGWRLRKDGSRFWANVVITALYGEGGQLYGFAKITRDLTERRKVEELEKEGRRLNRFLAMLGHELRNPLAPIRTASQVLLETVEGDSRAAWAAGVIERQAAHLTRIVDDLLDLSRINRDEVVLVQAPLDLVSLVVETSEAIRPVVEEAQLELSVTIPDMPLVVLGDATRLTQIIMNLLSNSQRYTPPGGHIAVMVEQDEAYAQLRVRDDGSGISEGLLPQVFDPFVQGDQTLDRSHGGLGIGLTLVRRLVELHEGTVSATSEGPGRGTEVVVRLPLSAEERAEPAAPAQKARKRHRILAVDDNADALDSMAILLEMWGHEVVTAGDGHSAIAAARRHHPDVVLLDIGLPGMDGFAVAEQLRDEPCVIVAMTGYGQSEDVDRARQSGFDHYLVKPVDTGKLERLLDDLPAKSGS